MVRGGRPSPRVHGTTPFYCKGIGANALDWGEMGSWSNRVRTKFKATLVVYKGGV